ncbi:MAG: cell division protein ZapB [Proteobacteria bacterium]|nr:cell division protein ZapB [Pseudomonadota bacterium]
MDEESILRDFDRLAERLDRLVLQCEALGKENVQLRDWAQTLEEELQKKTEAENRLMQERNEVRSRIDGLLARIQEAGPQNGGPA